MMGQEKINFWHAVVLKFVCYSKQKTWQKGFKTHKYTKQKIENKTDDKTGNKLIFMLKLSRTYCSGLGSYSWYIHLGLNIFYLFLCVLCNNSKIKRKVAQK